VKDATDVNAVAEGMLRLLTDSPTWEQFRERGLKNVNRFSQSRMAQQTLEMYRQLVHDQKAPKK
jgi:glycosyltransferase involved in cell wall biosynthesis